MTTLCQTRLPTFFTFYKQNNNKNVKKLATLFDRASLLNSSPFSTKWAGALHFDN